MKTILILTGIIIGFLGAMFMNQSYGADLAVEKPVVCEVCGKITADRIIDDNPLIELPNETVSFKYKGVEYTKAVLDTAKLTIEAIK